MSGAPDQLLRDSVFALIVDAQKSLEEQTPRWQLARALRGLSSPGSREEPILLWFCSLLEQYFVPATDRPARVASWSSVYRPGLDAAAPEFWSLAEEFIPRAEPRLAALISDHLWMQQRAYPHALTAIDSFLQAADGLLDGDDTWIEAIDYCARASERVRSLNHDLTELHMRLSDLVSRLQECNGAYRKFAHLLRYEISQSELLFDAFVPRLLIWVETSITKGHSYTERHLFDEVVEIYKACGKHTDANTLLHRQLKSIVREAESQGISSMMLSFILREGIDLAGKLGDTDAKDKLMRLLREHNQASIERMSEFSTTLTITKAEIEQLVDELLERCGPGEHAHLIAMGSAMGLWMEPNQLKASLDAETADNPLISLVSKVWLSNDGRGRPEPTSAERRKEVELVRHYAEQVAWWMLFLELMVGCLRDRGLWNTDRIMGALSQGLLFTGRACSAIRPAIEAFEDQRYWDAVHVLGPQVERTIRYLAERLSVNTMRVDRETGETQFLALGRLLGDGDLARALDNAIPGFAANLQAIFTDSYGKNLRNNIAHGLLDPAVDHRADTLLIVVVLLALAGFVRSKDTSEERSGRCSA